MSDFLHKMAQAFQKNSPHTNTFPSTPPPSTPPPTSPLKEVPRNHLAFRTITKLLAQIQQERMFQVLEKTPTKLLDPVLQELRLSSAFSTIAVIEHEIIAVVTSITPELLTVIAVPTISTKGDLPIAPEPSKPLALEPSRIIPLNWRLICTQNPCRSRSAIPTALHSEEPIICDAGILAGIELVDDEMLKVQVDQYW